MSSFDIRYIAGGRLDPPFYPVQPKPYGVGFRLEVNGLGDFVKEYTLPKDMELVKVAIGASRLITKDHWTVYHNDNVIMDTVFDTNLPEGVLCWVAHGTYKDDVLKFVYHSTDTNKKAVWFNYQFLTGLDVEPINYGGTSNPKDRPRRAHFSGVYLGKDNGHDHAWEEQTYVNNGTTYNVSDIIDLTSSNFKTCNIDTDLNNSSNSKNTLNSIILEMGVKMVVTRPDGSTVLEAEGPCYIDARKDASPSDVTNGLGPYTNDYLNNFIAYNSSKDKNISMEDWYAHDYCIELIRV